MTIQSAGRRFREAMAQEKPLQIMGTINAYAALLAEKTGYKAIYLSGGGVANTSLYWLISTQAGAARLALHVLSKNLNVPVLLRFILKTRWLQNVADIAQTKNLSPKKKWSIALKPLLTQKQTLTLS